MQLFNAEAKTSLYPYISVSVRATNIFFCYNARFIQISLNLPMSHSVQRFATTYDGVNLKVDQ